MRTPLGRFSIKNLHTGQYEEAVLYSPIVQSNIDDYENHWLPRIRARISNLGADENAASANVQDAHWAWREKKIDRTGRMDFESFAVECDGMTQGMLFVSLIAFAKEQSQRGQFLIYIDLISSAPWNRIGFTDNRLYKGVGPLLLGAAIDLSINEGFDGRIGLHSLPQSESWYRDGCEMTDLGIDGSYSQPLRYFEMTPAQARAFIS